MIFTNPATTSDSSCTVLSSIKSYAVISLFSLYKNPLGTNNSATGTSLSPLFLLDSAPDLSGLLLLLELLGLLQPPHAVVNTDKPNIKPNKSFFITKHPPLIW